MEVDIEGLAELERLRRVRGAAVLGSRAWDHACDEYHAALDAAYPHLITKLKEAKARIAALEAGLKPFAGIVGPFRAATETGRHHIPDEDFRRARDLLKTGEC